jgi:hypothetical protein
VVTTENVSAPTPSLPVPPEGAQAADPITFDVPPGTGRLDADMIWPDPANNSILQVQLFNPQGALTQESYDDGHQGRNGATGTVPDIQHVEVSDPAPGRWTARFLWSGTDEDLAAGPNTPGAYTGPMSFKVSGQNWVTSPAAGPVTIPAHSSVSVPLHIAMPRLPGDHPESVRFSARGASASVPVARRTLIPPSGGPFRTVITSTVGRAVGQVSTYEIDVPAGLADLRVSFHTADASADNQFTFYLVDPDQTVVSTDSTPKLVNGQPAATAELQAASPAAGVWQIDVVLNITVSGKEFTQTVYGDVQDP